ncbi:unnamed protein product [Linum tenue]|uniref:Major facilitator superfamily (MFS) profile domain-containing protein n=1 Tax=Linum tenue TaxID=586396 RepID=A0AAV0NL23_9ROSI|nr:unnamed protein product [Linum tenue]
MGFFTDAYDLFCITAVTKLIGRLYYFDPALPKPSAPGPGNAITGVALCGTLAGQLFFGWLGDKLGRKRVYGITLVTMVGCALCSGLSFGSTPKSVIGTLCFFRFWLGFGIGGDYPLSAVIMSEYSNQKTRGAFIAAVFAMQGMGILFAAFVTLIVTKIFLHNYPAPSFSQPEADFVWRLVLMLGAVPAALTFYWRMKMPETARYTALVQGNHKKAANDMAKVLQQDFSIDPESNPNPKSPAAAGRPQSSFGLFSSEFSRRHGLHLLGTTTTWFLLDIGFYSLQLAQKDVYTASGLLNKASTMNALEETYQLAKAMTIIALLATVPGYWFTVYFIDKIGRFIIQLVGFLLMSICMAILGLKYHDLRGEKTYCAADSVKYGLTLFFANFGPNSTTFIVPAEIFPARFRSTCHGVSAAAGKAGAIIGAFVVQSYTQSGDSNGIKKAMIGLSLVNLLGFFFTFLVPETKGKSLEELSGDDRELGSGDEKAVAVDVPPGPVAAAGNA